MLLKRPSSFHPFLRITSALLICAFFSQEIAHANPGIKGLAVSVQRTADRNILFGMPESVARIEDNFSAVSGQRTGVRKNLSPDASTLTPGNPVLFLIQDAHTNPSAQFNIAKTIQHLVQKENIQTVYVEAGFGDVSLTPYKSNTSAQRKFVGEKYVRRGELSGAEFYDLTSDANVALWGVEDEALYWKSLELYRTLAKEREKFSDYLIKLKRSVEELKPDVLHPLLRGFDAKREAFLDGKLTWSEYFEALSKYGKWMGVTLKDYPELERLTALRIKEKAIDFEKANEEAQVQRSADSGQRTAYSGQVSAVLPPDSSTLAPDHNPLGNYSELKKYEEYQKAFKELKMVDMLREQEEIEKVILAALSENEDERRIIEIGDIVRHWKALINLTILPDQFQFVSRKSSTDLREITGFLNQKIMDLEDHYEHVIYLNPDFEKTLATAEEFYKATQARDEIFVRKTLQKMSEKGEAKAVLVTGGYHSPNLKSLLKQKNISYVSLQPAVASETNIERYERLLLKQSQGHTVTKSQKNNRQQTTDQRLETKDKLAVLMLMNAAAERRAGFGQEFSPVTTLPSHQVTRKKETRFRNSLFVRNKLFPGHLNILGDFAHQTAAYFLASMNGNRGLSSIRVAEAGMATFLTNLFKTQFFKNTDNEDGFKRDKPWTQTATLTSWRPTNLSGLGILRSALRQTLIAAWILLSSSGMVLAWEWQPWIDGTLATNKPSSSRSINTTYSYDMVLPSNEKYTTDIPLAHSIQRSAVSGQEAGSRVQKSGARKEIFLNQLLEFLNRHFGVADDAAQSPSVDLTVVGDDQDDARFGVLQFYVTSMMLSTTRWLHGYSLAPVIWFFPENDIRGEWGLTRKYNHPGLFPTQLLTSLILSSNEKYTTPPLRSPVSGLQSQDSGARLGDQKSHVTKPQGHMDVLEIRSQNSYRFSNSWMNLFLKSFGAGLSKSRFFIPDWISSISSGGILTRTIPEWPENLRSDMAKSESWVMRILFPATASASTLPFLSPFGENLTSWPNLVRNPANLWWIFSSIKKRIDLLQESRFELALLENAPGVVESGFDVLAGQARVGFLDLSKRQALFQHMQDKVKHYAGPLEAGLSVTDLRIHGNVFLYQFIVLIAHWFLSLNEKYTTPRLRSPVSGLQSQISGARLADEEVTGSPERRVTSRTIDNRQQTKTKPSGTAVQSSESMVYGLWSGNSGARLAEENQFGVNRSSEFGDDSANREFADADAVVFNDDHGRHKVGFFVSLKQTFQTKLYQIWSRVSHAEKNNSGVLSAAHREDDREVQIHGQKDSLIIGSPFQNEGIRRLGESDVASVDGVVTQLFQPFGNSWRNRHVEQKFHVSNLGGSGERLFAGQPSSILNSLLNIAFGQIGIIGKDLALFLAGGQEIQYQMHRNPQASNAGRAIQKIGVNGDMFEASHSSNYTTDIPSAYSGQEAGGRTQEIGARLAEGTPSHVTKSQGHMFETIDNRPQTKNFLNQLIEFFNRHFGVADDAAQSPSVDLTVVGDDQDDARLGMLQLYVTSLVPSTAIWFRGYSSPLSTVYGLWSDVFGARLSWEKKWTRRFVSYSIVLLILVEIAPQILRFLYVDQAPRLRSGMESVSFELLTAEQWEKEGAVWMEARYATKAAAAYLKSNLMKLAGTQMDGYLKNFETNPEPLYQMLQSYLGLYRDTASSLGLPSVKNDLSNILIEVTHRNSQKEWDDDFISSVRQSIGNAAKQVPAERNQPSLHDKGGARLSNAEGDVEVVLLGGHVPNSGNGILVTLPKNQAVLFDIGLSERFINEELPKVLKRRELKAVFISHAHADHSLGIPHLHRQYPTVQIYATDTTARILGITLEDAAKRSGLDGEGMQELRQMNRDAIDSRRPVDLNTWVELGDGIRAYFREAGHIPGAVSVFLETPEKNIFYTGDISLSPQIHVPGADTSPLPARPDLVIMESTYGGRSLDPVEERHIELVNETGDTLRQDGRVVIPSFTVGRPLEVASILRDAMLLNQIPTVPIYLDGMAANIVYVLKMDPLYASLKDWFNDGHIIQAVRGRDHRQQILNGQEPFVIIAGAGMMEGGAILRYFAALAADPLSKLIFVGYQHHGTFGSKVKLAMQGDMLTIPEEVNRSTTALPGKPAVPLMMARANVSLSAHADHDQLVRFIAGIQSQFPGHTIEFALIHGDDEAKSALKRERRLRDTQTRFSVGFNVPGDILRPGITWGDHFVDRVAHNVRSVFHMSEVQSHQRRPKKPAPTTRERFIRPKTNGTGPDLLHLVSTTMQGNSKVRHILEAYLKGKYEGKSLLSARLSLEKATGIKSDHDYRKAAAFLSANGARLAYQTEPWRADVLRTLVAIFPTVEVLPNLSILNRGILPYLIKYFEQGKLSEREFAILITSLNLAADMFSEAELESLSRSVKSMISGLWQSRRYSANEIKAKVTRFYRDSPLGTVYLAIPDISWTHPYEDVVTKEVLFWKIDRFGTDSFIYEPIADQKMPAVRITVLRKSVGGARLAANPAVSGQESEASKTFSHEDRKRMIRELISGKDEIYDVLVVGGGVSGANAVREARLRGYTAVLAERGDFAEGASSRSTNVFHGYIRYFLLAYEELLAIRSDRQIRQHVSTAMSHMRTMLYGIIEKHILAKTTGRRLAAPVEFAIPLEAGSKHGIIATLVGVWAYALFSNLAAVMVYKTLWIRWRWPKVVLSGMKAADHLGVSLRPDLKGYVTVHEYLTDDALYVRDVIRDAYRKGAKTLSRTEVINKKKDPDSGIWTVTLEDLSRKRGNQFQIKTREIVDATNSLSPVFEQPTLKYQRGTHFIVTDPDIVNAVDHTLLIPIPGTSRLLFVIRHEENGIPYLRIGTTDEETSDPASTYPTLKEIIELVRVFNGHFPQHPIGAGHIIAAESGVRVIIPRGDAKGQRASREFEVVRSEEGVIHMRSVKLVEGRRAGEQVGRLLEISLGRRPSAASSRKEGITPTHGDASVVTGTSRQKAKIPRPMVAWIKHEIDHADLEHFDDLMFRRDGEIILNDIKTMRQAFSVMSGMLDWTDGTRDEQWQEFQAEKDKRMAAVREWEESLKNGAGARLAEDGQNDHDPGDSLRILRDHGFSDDTARKILGKLSNEIFLERRALLPEYRDWARHEMAGMIWPANLHGIWRLATSAYFWKVQFPTWTAYSPRVIAAVALFFLGGFFTFAGELAVAVFYFGVSRTPSPGLVINLVYEAAITVLSVVAALLMVSIREDASLLSMGRVPGLYLIPSHIEDTYVVDKQISDMVKRELKRNTYAHQPVRADSDATPGARLSAITDDQKKHETWTRISAKDQIFYSIQGNPLAYIAEKLPFVLNPWTRSLIEKYRNESGALSLVDTISPEDIPEYLYKDPWLALKEDRLDLAKHHLHVVLSSGFLPARAVGVWSDDALTLFIERRYRYDDEVYEEIFRKAALVKKDVGTQLATGVTRREFLVATPPLAYSLSKAPQAAPRAADISDKFRESMRASLSATMDFVDKNQNERDGEAYNLLTALERMIDALPELESLDDHEKLNTFLMVKPATGLLKVDPAKWELLNEREKVPFLLNQAKRIVLNDQDGWEGSAEAKWFNEEAININIATIPTDYRERFLKAYFKIAYRDIVAKKTELKGWHILSQEMRRDKAPKPFDAMIATFSDTPFFKKYFEDLRKLLDKKSQVDDDKIWPAILMGSGYSLKHREILLAIAMKKGEPFQVVISRDLKAAEIAGDFEFKKWVGKIRHDYRKELSPTPGNAGARLSSGGEDQIDRDIQALLGSESLNLMKILELLIDYFGKKPQEGARLSSSGEVTSAGDKKSLREAKKILREDEWVKRRNSLYAFLKSRASAEVRYETALVGLFDPSTNIRRALSDRIGGNRKNVPDLSEHLPVPIDQLLDHLENPMISKKVFKTIPYRRSRRYDMKMGRARKREALIWALVDRLGNPRDLAAIKKRLKEATRKTNHQVDGLTLGSKRSLSLLEIMRIVHLASLKKKSAGVPQQSSWLTQSVSILLARAGDHKEAREFVYAPQDTASGSRLASQNIRVGWYQSASRWLLQPGIEFFLRDRVRLVGEAITPDALNEWLDTHIPEAALGFTHAASSDTAPASQHLIELWDITENERVFVLDRRLIESQGLWRWFYHRKDAGVYGLKHLSDYLESALRLAEQMTAPRFRTSSKSLSELAIRQLGAIKPSSNGLLSVAKSGVSGRGISQVYNLPEGNHTDNILRALRRDTHLWELFIAYLKERVESENINAIYVHPNVTTPMMKQAVRKGFSRSGPVWTSLTNTTLDFDLSSSPTGARLSQTSVILSDEEQKLIDYAKDMQEVIGPAAANAAALHLQRQLTALFETPKLPISALPVKDRNLHIDIYGGARLAGVSDDELQKYQQDGILVDIEYRVTRGGMHIDVMHGYRIIDFKFQNGAHLLIERTPAPGDFPLAKDLIVAVRPSSVRGSLVNSNQEYFDAVLEKWPSRKKALAISLDPRTSALWHGEEVYRSYYGRMSTDEFYQAIHEAFFGETPLIEKSTIDPNLAPNTTSAELTTALLDYLSNPNNSIKAIWVRQPEDADRTLKQRAFFHELTIRWSGAWLAETSARSLQLAAGSASEGARLGVEKESSQGRTGTRDQSSASRVQRPADRRQDLGVDGSKKREGARMAIKTEIISKFAEFGIDVDPVGKVSFDRVPIDGAPDWVMDRMRKPELLKIHTTLDQMPTFSVWNDLELADFPVIGTGKHNDGIHVVLIQTVDGEVHPAVVKKLYRGERQFTNETVNVQFYGNRGYSPKFYGIKKSEEAYAMQLVIIKHDIDVSRNYNYPQIASAIRLMDSENSGPLVDGWVETRVEEPVATDVYNMFEYGYEEEERVKFYGLVERNNQEYEASLGARLGESQTTDQRLEIADGPQSPVPNLPSQNPRPSITKLRNFILALAVVGNLFAGSFALKSAHAATPTVIETRIELNGVVAVHPSSANRLVTIPDLKAELINWKIGQIDKREARRAELAAQSGFMSAVKQVHELLPIPEMGTLNGFVKIDAVKIRQKLTNDDEFNNFLSLLFEVMSIHGGNYYISGVSGLASLEDRAFIGDLISGKANFAKIVTDLPQGIVVEALFSDYEKSQLAAHEFAVSFEGLGESLPNISAIRIAEELAHFFSDYVKADGTFDVTNDMLANLGESPISKAMTRFTDQKSNMSGQKLFDYFKRTLEKDEAEPFFINPIRVLIEIAQDYQRARWAMVST